MKKVFWAVVINFFIISFACAASDKVVLANGEWEPYLSKKLINYGFASHVVSRAFEISGIEVEYKWYDNFWKRAYKDAKDGVVDGALVFSKKPERELEMFFTDPVFDGKKDVFFYLRGSRFDWSTFTDLQGKLLGGTIGYNYGEGFEYAEKIGIFKTVRVKNDYLNFKALLLGRIDAFVAGEAAGYKVLSEKFTPEERERILHHKKPVRVATYHLVLTKKKIKSRDLRDKFNYGLKVLKETGEYKRMKENFKKGYYLQEFKR